jgi:hypothetical protein
MYGNNPDILLANRATPLTVGSPMKIEPSAKKACKGKIPATYPMITVK